MLPDIQDPTLQVHYMPPRGGNHKDPDVLTPRERLFIDEYLIDRNGTRAYKAAGYVAKNDNIAGAQASQLLVKQRVANFIRTFDAARSMKAGANLDKIIHELLCIAHLDPADVFDFTGDRITLLKAADIPEHARRAISSIKIRQERIARGRTPAEVTEIKFHSKLEALDKLMRRLGAYPDARNPATPDQPAGLGYEIDKLQLDLETRKKILAAMQKVYGDQPAPDTTKAVQPTLNAEVSDGTEAQTEQPDGVGPGGQPEPGDQGLETTRQPTEEARLLDMGAEGGQPAAVEEGRADLHPEPGVGHAAAG